MVFSKLALSLLFFHVYFQAIRTNFLMIVWKLVLIDRQDVCTHILQNLHNFIFVYKKIFLNRWKLLNDFLMIEKKMKFFSLFFIFWIFFPFKKQMKQKQFANYQTPRFLSNSDLGRYYRSLPFKETN